MSDVLHSVLEQLVEEELLRIGWCDRCFPGRKHLVDLEKHRLWLDKQVMT